MVARYHRGFIVAMLALALVFWTGTGMALVKAHQIVAGIPDRSTLDRVTRMARSSVFYDRHGKPAFTISREQRIEVPLERISPHLRDAILAIEDQRFYDHRGVDLVRVGGAALANLREGRAAQGASTITQQLARLSFLTPDKTYTRKLQEVVLAALLETEYSKDQILELYLNKVYFGSGLYGAEAASLGYFGKHASELTVAEAALLAGLVKAPSNYAPTVDLQRAVNRRAIVLNQMHAMGAIDVATLEQAKKAKVELVDALRREEPYGRYFKDHVRRELISRFGEERVYEGGLRVYTTLDLEMQRAADAEVQRVLAALEKRRQTRKPSRSAAAEDAAARKLQAALIAMDPATGEVRALIGGRDFLESNFNRATLARRQSGSAFKPFVYAAAIEAGFTPATLITDLDRPVATPEGAWVPDDGHSTATAMTMRAALKTSSNRAAVRMIEQVGIGKAVSYAARLGVDDIPRVPSAALGSGDVTLEALTAAYAVFANGGMRQTPVYVTRVEDADGNVLFTAQPQAERVVSAQTAFLMNDLLADVIDHGTAWKARQLGFRLPAAGKTGTTNDYRDAWFVGYTPQIVAGVWVGFDQPQTIIRDGYASDVAVPLWAGFMKEVTRGDRAEWYKPPSGIVTATVCRLSGKRPTEACHGSFTQADDGTTTSSSSVYTEYFVRGTVPEETCPLHTWRSMDTRTASAWNGQVWGPAAPVPPATVRAQIESARQAAQAAAEKAKAEEPKKKRGFWSRLFGIGRDDDKKDKKDEQEKQDEQDEQDKKDRQNQQDEDRDDSDRREQSRNENDEDDDSGDKGDSRKQEKGEGGRIRDRQ